jgi:hypothetical protein
LAWVESRQVRFPARWEASDVDGMGFCPAFPKFPLQRPRKENKFWIFS